MANLSQYRLCIFCLLLCFYSQVLSAQKTVGLSIQVKDRPQTFIDSLPLKTSFNTLNAARQYVKQLPSLLAAHGYISSSADSTWQDSMVHVQLFVGEKYSWDQLTVKQTDWPLLEEMGYDQSSFSKRPFNQQQVAALYEKLLDYFAASGYPFASVQLDSLSVENGSVKARLMINKGSLYHIDSIRIFGDVKLSPSFLHHYLDILPHEVYNVSKLDKINQRLQQLPYIEQTQPWALTMLNTGAILNLYLRPRHSNEINVIAGFLPANDQSGGKLLFTGEAALNLKNAFATGESIALHWQQLQPRSPRLDLSFQRPYLFNSPFGLDVSFELYKKDSLFLNINAQFGVLYALSAQQSGKVFLQTARTNVLSIDTLAVIATKTLPDMIDVHSVSLGIQYQFNNTDYRYNPRKGNELSFTVSAGTKNVTRNNAVLQIKDSSFNYSALYDTFPLRSYQFRMQANAAHYFSIGRQAAVKAAVNAGWFQSPSYYTNELFQIGGYRLLRGFDEESIYANRFVTGTLEYHYLLAQNSYFFGFTDAGWAGRTGSAVSVGHFYTGAGLGLALETKTGVFNISIAEGKRDDLKLDLRQTKIHLGFASVF